MKTNKYVTYTCWGLWWGMGFNEEKYINDKFLVKWNNQGYYVHTMSSASLALSMVQKIITTAISLATLGFAKPYFGPSFLFVKDDENVHASNKYQ